MGRKRTRARKLVYFCVAGLIVLVLQGCVPLEKMRVEIKERVEARQYLHRGKGLLAQADYEGAIHEHLKILSLAIHRPPEDEALFNMARIYAHPGYPNKDYQKSIFFFEKLLKDFPQSPWSEHAKIWVGILQENEKLNQTVETLDRMNAESRQLGRRIEEWEQAREPFLLSEKLLSEGNYEGALKENQRILSASGQNPPGDGALFNLGLILAHPGNMKKDYAKSLALFRRLLKDHPGSPWAEQAKTWVGVLQENEKLSRSIEELSVVIEKSKQVDIEIEEKKREKAK
jgi:tetratricopeptide (TPR) repeat protein